MTGNEHAFLVGAMSYLLASVVWLTLFTTFIVYTLFTTFIVYTLFTTFIVYIKNSLTRPKQMSSANAQTSVAVPPGISTWL